ncbi:LLM class F420-dependent oxidoreductase [Pseudonocardia sp. GCM10023141]|uniref:LLM class F420-dependent oxidoreductase n=1 Tax=Pseudonocardia sp. GCM10023141 TaxID=3252653 RepID=UPI00361D8307
MQHGVVTFLTDYGLEPVPLGRAVEERGFDALFLTEHTHIPTSRLSPWPGGAELPRRYAHTYDPFVALSAIAATTQRIALGTGVSLVAQHDPIVLAKAVASLDRIAGGRFELGIGPGWNKEEMADHGVDPASRTARMREHVLAMQAIWAADEAEFHGRFVDFGPIWSWPKPTRTPPVLIGGGGPTVLDRVLEYGTGWIPLRVPLDDMSPFAARIAELRSRAADAGRPRPDVTVYGAVPKPAALESYATAGVDRVLFELRDQDDTAAALAELDGLAALRP